MSKALLVKHWIAVVAGSIVLVAVLTLSFVLFDYSPVKDSDGTSLSVVSANCSTGLDNVRTRSNALRSKVTLDDGTIVSGETLAIPMVLDKALNGLAGYHVAVISTDVSIAKIDSVDPANIGIVRRRGDAQDSRMRFAAVDFNKDIEAGAGEFTLADINIKGVAPGTADIQLKVFQMDDDFGEPIQPKVFSGTVTVC